MASNPDNIRNPIYDTLENINDVSALNEKEENPDLNPDMSNGRARGGNRKKRRNRKPQRSAANWKTVCTEKGKGVRRKKIPLRGFSRPMLDVSCKETKGVLHKEKMKKGIYEKCIFANEQWFTLSEFEELGGCKKAKSWKRSIRCGNVPLEILIKKGKLPKFPHHRKGKRRAPVHQAPQFQSSDVICVDDLDQATGSTASVSPSEDADIQSQQSPGSEDVIVAAEGPAMASETTASKSVDSLFSNPLPTSFVQASTSASNQRTGIPSNLRRTTKQLLNTSLDYRTMHTKLQAIKNLLGGLKEALNMSVVKKQMSDIYQQTLPLKTSVEKIQKTLGLEEPQL
nr:PREDICTED: uncharacterized protein LOC103278223 [Anolis carolinensis]|eukprot:XP_008104651.1 PREDICTED: uncharacterized protein LOC103278223 [Anolis carolinensis]